MWDYKTGKPFQHMNDVPQPGSLDAEAVSGRVRDGGCISGLMTELATPRASSARPLTAPAPVSSRAERTRRSRFTPSSSWGRLHARKCID